MTNESVDTTSKERRHIRHTIQHCYTSRHAPWLNHWQVTLTFCFNYSHVLPVNHCYIQRIVWATNPQSMYVGAWCKIKNNFCYARSAILEAIHALPWINTSTVVKKGNGTQRKTQVSPWCSHCSYYRWWKGISWAKAMLNVEKNEPVALAIVAIDLSWPEGTRQSVS